MKKIIIPLVLVLLLAISLPFAAISILAEGETSAEKTSKKTANIPDDTVITYGYLQQFKEEIRQEIIDELTSNGGITVTSTYNDISAKEGQLIILSPESEVIYRGGGAVAITSSNAENEGITDMSEGKELFSGEPLEYGHIYYASASESRKAILVTGGTAYFTIRGDYEIG